MSERRRCAFLTMADRGDYVIDDDRVAAPLAELGWDLEERAWDDPSVDWASYAIIVVRSTWDYHERRDEFLRSMEALERGGAVLENRLATLRWNADKRYLRELDRAGVGVVPSVWAERLERGGVGRLLDGLGSEEIVLKPQVGASASGVYRLRAGSPLVEEAERYFADRALVAQPFVETVIDSGELSLVFFAGRFSHALSKLPARGDFRVQEELGGRIAGVEPPKAAVKAAHEVLDRLDDSPLYARVDVVPSPDGGWWLMELELIEPSLYLRTDAEAPRRFAHAIVERAASRIGR